MKPAIRARMGDALAALGREVGLTSDDIAIIEQTLDNSPAKPMTLDDRAPRRM